METTPSKAMKILVCLTPLDIYIKDVAVITMFRLRTVVIKTFVGAGIIRTRLGRESLDVKPVIQTKRDSIAPRFVFDTLYRLLTNQITYPKIVNALIITNQGVG